ncbi:MAG: DUF3144 domain-containing protein [Gammaproteobacteria bacterium]|jgi:hypothetical protein|nr:DUF3144 domain-containing protein [Gammaproteobacteria bacterium]
MSAPETQQDAIQAFIDLANKMKTDGASVQMISTAMMRACAVYSTYVVAGNEGALRETGVEKLKEIFGKQLEVVQKAKLAQASADAQ